MRLVAAVENSSEEEVDEAGFMQRALKRAQKFAASTARSAAETTIRAQTEEPNEESSGSWPPFWNPACEVAFEALKEAASQAITLCVPDFAGAADGTNPFHIHSDACNYAVGAGIFQKAKLAAEHY